MNKTVYDIFLVFVHKVNNWDKKATFCRDKNDALWKQHTRDMKKFYIKINYSWESDMKLIWDLQSINKESNAWNEEFPLGDKPTIPLISAKHERKHV